MQRDPAQHKAAQRVTVMGAIINSLLSLIKIAVGYLSFSAALIADGIHSLSDLFTDLMVIVILKISGKGPDENHPWGHAHFETVGTALLGSVLIAVAGAMAYDSVLNLIHSEDLRIPQWPALVVAFISIIANEWIFRFTLKTGKQVGSDLLIANAWHSRTDAFSSIVVFVGIAGAMAGVLWLDAATAIAVAVLVAKIGWDLSWSSFQQLVDTALPPDVVEKYKDQVMSVEGVLNVHNFKTRAMGNKSLLEMHLQVSPRISASEGHQIGDAACKKLLDNGDIGHIIYHIDTFDDETAELMPSTSPLPSRQEVEPVVKRCLYTYIEDLQLYRLNLHYHRDLLELEILLPQEEFSALLAAGEDPQQIIGAIRDALKDVVVRADRLGKIYLAGGYTA